MKELAVQLAVVRELEKRLKEAKDYLNGQFLKGLDEGDSKAAALPDGTRLGKVSKVSGRVSIRVEDDAKFLAWVKENHPAAIVESVADWFQNEVLERAKKTYELPPGVNVHQGEAFISYRAEKHAPQVIQEMWRDVLPGVLEIES